MFLTVHASVGAVIGEEIGSSNLAFVLGFLSHFFLDMIPHGDEIIGRELVKPGRVKWVALLFVLDFMAAFSVLILFWLGGVIRNPVAAFSGALGAVLPDILSGFTLVSQGKLWPDFNKLHGRAHCFLGQQFSLLAGGVIQFATFFLVWLVVMA